MKQIGKRLTFANVMSSLAVFLVVAGGTAFAAEQLAKNSVGAKQLKSNAVTSAKIKKEAVAAAKIKKEAVNGAKIKNGAVTSGKLALSSVGRDQLDANERSEVIATSASNAFDLVDSYNPATWTTVMSLNLPNGSWVVTASLGFAFGAESSVGCRILQAGSVLAQSGVQGEDLGLVPGLGGIDMTAVASAGQVTVACGDSAAGVSAVNRTLVATRAGSVTSG